MVFNHYILGIRFCHRISIAELEDLYYRTLRLKPHRLKMEKWYIKQTDRVHQLIWKILCFLTVELDATYFYKSPYKYETHQPLFIYFQLNTEGCLSIAVGSLSSFITLSSLDIFEKILPREDQK